MLAGSLLGPVQARCSAKDFRELMREHAAELVGFGVPLGLLFRSAPLTALLLLDLLQGVAAVLFARLAWAAKWLDATD